MSVTISLKSGFCMRVETDVGTLLAVLQPRSSGLWHAYYCYRLLSGITPMQRHNAVKNDRLDSDKLPLVRQRQNVPQSFCGRNGHNQAEIRWLANHATPSCDPRRAQQARAA